jgi:hypothetical protein
VKLRAYLSRYLTFDDFSLLEPYQAGLVLDSELGSDPERPGRALAG